MTKNSTSTFGMSEAIQDMTLTALAGQASGMSLLLAEMQALAHVLPSADEQAHKATDAEIEAEFDNMPV